MTPQQENNPYAACACGNPGCTGNWSGNCKYGSRAPAPTEPAVDRDADPIGDFQRGAREAKFSEMVREWQAATPASLAVPGKQFKDHDIRQLVNDLRAIAVEFHAAGQLRERISGAVKQFLSAPSAPEPAPLAPMEKGHPIYDLLMLGLGTIALMDADKGAEYAKEVRAVLGIAPQVAQASQPIPDVLFDGMAVFNEVHSSSAKIGAKDVSEVLDAVVRLMRASQPTSAEELQQDKRMPPVAAPVSQRDIIEAAALKAGVVGKWDPFSEAFRVFLPGNMFLGKVWTPTAEQLKTGRCRAQGGITNDSKGLPTSAEGKDSERLEEGA